MAKKLRLTRWSHPEDSFGLSPESLGLLLRPHREHLSLEGVFIDGGLVDLEMLTRRLAEFGHDLPEDLVAGMVAVEELGHSSNYDDLHSILRGCGVCIPETATSADLVVLILLERPDELERLYALRLPVARRKFKTFLAVSESLPEVPDIQSDMLEVLRRDLDSDFSDRGRGSGLHIYCRHEDAYRIRFTIRRGETTQREVTVDPDSGGARNITFRPMRYDIVTYNADEGSLVVNARTSADGIAYAAHLGKHLFDDLKFFMADGVPKRYTLEPLIQGPDSIAWRDCSNIVGASLTGSDWFHGSATGLTTRKRGKDVFKGMQRAGERIPPRAQICGASFRLELVGGRSISVRIVPPDQAVLGRAEDAEIVMDWLSKRGMLLERKVASRGLTRSLVGTH